MRTTNLWNNGYAALNSNAIQFYFFFLGQIQTRRKFAFPFIFNQPNSYKGIFISQALLFSNWIEHFFTLMTESSTATTAQTLYSSTNVILINFDSHVKIKNGMTANEPHRRALEGEAFLHFNKL